MADISQLEVDGITYDICDAVARDTFSRYFSDNGDLTVNAVTINSTGFYSIDTQGGFTLNGTDSIQFKDQRMDSSYNGLPENETEATRTIFVRDVNNHSVAVFRGRQLADGTTVAMIEACGTDSDSNDIWTSLGCRVSKTGVRSYYINDPTAFRSAINALSLGGGTLTGDLNMSLDNGTATHLRMKDSRMNRAYNGVPTTGAQVERCIGVQDKDGNWLGRITFRQTAAGRKYTLIESVGVNSSGNSVWCSVAPYVDADGTAGYWLTNPAAFCSVLHVGDRVVKDQTSAVSLATATWSNIASISLAAGTWVIEGTIQFSSNATGRRYACVSEAGGTSVSASDQRQTGANVTAVNGGSTLVHVGCTKVYNTTTTLYLCGWQNSGAALNTYGCISAVRIK